MGHEASHFLQVLGAVGHEQKLVRPVEVHQAARLPRALHDVAVALAGEDALDEVLAQDRVVQATLVLHGGERKVLHEDPREEADADFDGTPLSL